MTTSSATSKDLTKAGPSSSTEPSAQITLTKEALDVFQPSKVFSAGIVDTSACITSLSFDDRGEYLLSAGDDDTVHLWSCKTGKHQLKTYSKKYGIDLARFTHRSSTIIYASTKVDNTIRHLELQGNKYLQYFRGHEAKVTSLVMSPIDDSFLSAAKNESVRLWDVRSPVCQGLFPINGHPVVAFDPEGLIFAIALNEHALILLYDLRKFTSKPFLIIPIDDSRYHSAKSFPPRIPVITSLSFSPNGTHILAGTAGDLHYVIDSHDGFVLHRLLNHEGLEKVTASAVVVELGMVAEAGISGQECGWTPEGRFVYSGSADNKIRFWHIPDYPPANGLRNGEPPQLQNLFAINALDGHPASPTRVVRFNPRHAMFASASSQVALWLPDLDEIV